MMKKMIFWFAFVMMFMVFFAGCKSTDFVWDPSGNWTWTITGSWNGVPWIETLTFTGGVSSGLVNGWEFSTSGVAGNWTKSGDYTVNITFDFYYMNTHDHLQFTGTSSESNPNMMSGSGTWMFYKYGVLDDSWTMTFTAVKTSNLQ